MESLVNAIIMSLPPQVRVEADSPQLRASIELRIRGYNHRAIGGTDSDWAQLMEDPNTSVGQLKLVATGHLRVA
jgi:hypothetical protein